MSNWDKIEQKVNSWKSTGLSKTAADDNHPLQGQARIWDQMAKWLDNAAYGLANFFGLGEAYTTISGWLTSLFGGQKIPSPAELSKAVSTLSDKIGVEINQVLAGLDAQLGAMPIALSQNMKRVTQQARKKLIDKRNKLSNIQQRADNQLNSINNLAITATSLPTGQRREAVDTIAKSIEETVAGVEKGLNDVQKKE